MAIKGMTNQAPSFPEIGQLRKGSKKRKSKSGKEIWGADLDHFRFTSEIPEVARAFEAVYDGEPRLINVLLPFRTTDENWEAWQEEYRAGGLVHRCDGDTMVLWQKEDGSYSNEPKRCPYAAGRERTTKEPGCKPTARLKVVIPELRRLAYVTVLTNSTHDIRNLDAQLRALETLRQDLRGIPLQLRRAAKTISTPKGDGTRIRRQKWLLSIEAAPNWVSLQLAAQEAAAVPQLPEGAKLWPHDDEVVTVHPVTGEILDDEDEWDEDAFDAGEDEEDEPPLVQREPEPPQQNGTRPLSPEKVRDTVRIRSGWQNGQRYMDGEPASDGQVRAIGSLMNEAFPNLKAALRDKARHDVLNYLIGVTSSNDLYKKEASAIIRWLKVPEDDCWDLHPATVQECAAIIEAIAKEAGQKELPL